MTNIKLYAADYFIVISYFVGIILLGFKYRNSHKGNIENYLLAGRRISLPAFTATLVSTWYGGILGIGEFTYLYGILNWVTQALPYYIFATIFAFFLAGKIRKLKQFTISDILYNSYGKKTGTVGSIFVLILVTPAPHLLMVSLLISSIFHIPFIYGLLIAVVFSTSYVMFGGFRSVVKTDMLQFLLMFFGFGILLFVLIKNYGAFDFLQSNLPRNHYSITGGQNMQYIFVWGFIALWTFVDPGFYQRCFSAKSPSTAKYGILLAVFFWVIFDILTTMSGLYARALLSDINPVMAFPRLGEMVLPQILRGFFIVGLLATIMSTLDSNTFLSAVTFGRDFVWRIKKSGNVNLFTQVGLVVTIIISIIIIYLIPSVIKIWYTLGTLFIPGLLFPILSSFTKGYKISSKSSLLCLVLAFLITLIWMLIGIYYGSFEVPLYPLKIQPFFAGLFLSAIIYIIDIFFQLKKINY